jgi:peptidoglycan/xylan/chitin deacetylase (PgdA/CDA1 family)
VYETLSTGLKNIIKKSFQKEPVVLMYHRIAEPSIDPWDLCVSPQHFKEHLEVLKSQYKVIPVSELLQVKNRIINIDNHIVLTFDDGYEDNYTNAKPLLEACQTPACFFIANDLIDTKRQYWWDELEEILLHTKALPVSLSLSVNDEQFTYKTDPFIRSELFQYISPDKDVSSIPNLDLYLQLWKRMRPLPFGMQQEILDGLRKWTGKEKQDRHDHHCMSSMQLKQMMKNELFEIGVHTVHHPALADHRKEVQEKELNENKKWLEDITGRRMGYCAYPYGSYNNDTLCVMKDSGFKAAFTTNPERIKRSSDPYQLGRLQVRNWNGGIFEKQLKAWLKAY